MNLTYKTLLGITASVVISSCSNTENDTKKNEVTPSSFDITQLDSTQNPCDNFLLFATAGWMKNNPVPESEGKWGSFNVLNEANQLKIKAIIESAQQSKPEKYSPLQQVGDFYTAAMDSNTSNQLGIKPIQSLLNQVEEVNTVQELVEQMVQLKKQGSGSIFSYHIALDAKNSSEYILHFSQGGIGLPNKNYYFPEDDKGKNILAAYEKHIAAALHLSGMDKTTASKNATQILQLETDLAQNCMSPVELRDPNATYNKLSREELSALCPIIDWNSFFAATEIDNNKIENLIITQPAYFSALNNSLEKTPLNTWKAYLKWQLINDMSSFLGDDFEKEYFSFYSTTLYGVKTMKPRWERALRRSNRYVGHQIGKIYVEEYFPEASKQKVLDLITNISAVFKERVQTLDWMSAETKEKALEKLSKFTYKIGYPDQWKDYSSIDINDNTLVQNILNTTYYSYKTNINRLGSAVDKKEWGMTPQTINAGYNPLLNEIIFPAAILQPPFFNPDADDAINYGAIGAVIGHEFSHGFDDQGGKYDGEGNLANWWTEEDEKNFNQRTAKLVSQFNQFEILGENHVNGELTLGENIADLSGLTLAYYALIKSLEDKKEPTLIDGFDYKQRFFLGWAQVWHENSTDEYLMTQVKTDPHAPAQFRILGPLANMPEFFEAFDCSEGNMIIPDSSRVSIW